jgi:hypothetical protein
MTVLAGILASHTRTPERCWFGLWDGFNNLVGVEGITESELRRPSLLAPLGLAPRAYLLFTGSISEASSPVYLFDQQSPNLIWPEDRAWFVGTEIDFDSTLIAGTEGLIKEIVRCPQLEARPVQPSYSLACDADLVNGTTS